MEDYYRYGELSHPQKLQLAIRNVLSIDQTIRPVNKSMKPGGLLEFPKDDTREVIVIGDLHANKQNLKAILMDDQNLYKLKTNEAIIIILGDSMHDERVGHLREMDTSIEIMDIIIHLINDYPEMSFISWEIMTPSATDWEKSGIKQGLIYLKALTEKRGKEYVSQMQAFFNSLPVFVIHPLFLAVHAGPVRGGVTREDLIDVREQTHENVLRQLTWNRLNETRSSASLKEYSPDDLIMQREALGFSRKIPIIVGHNPMWKWGNEDSIWIDILGSKNHVILYSNLEGKATYISFTGSQRYRVKHAALKIKKQKYILGNMRL